MSLVTTCAALAATGAAISAHPAFATPASTAHGARAAASPGALASSAAASTAASTAAFGAVGGHVRSADAGPLARVCVIAAGRAGVVMAHVMADGRYLITDLRPGAYTVSYHACGGPARYWPASTSATVLAGQPTWLQPVTLQPVTLQPVTLRQVSPGLATPWRAGGRLATRSGDVRVSGTVRSVAGKALTGICVSATARTRSFEVGAEAHTGRGGTYSLDLFPGPGWTIEFTTGCDNRGNFAPQWWRHSATSKGATPLHVRKGEHLTDINASLGVGATITGTVRSAGSTPKGLAGVCVAAAGTGPMSAFTDVTATGPTGAYRLYGLGTGAYRVLFDPQCFGYKKSHYLPSSYHGLIHVTDGKTVTSVNGILTPAARISGTVTTGGATPVAGICVIAASSAGAFGPVITDSHGGYSIGGLPAGHYTVSFSGDCGNAGSFAPQYYNGQATQAAADPVVAVAGQTTSGINANMQPGATITGTVTNYSGAKLSGICVAVASAGDVGGAGPSPAEGLLAGLPLFSALTETASGSYQIPDLAPGSYQVSFFSGCGGGKSPAYAAQWFTPQGGSSPTWLPVGAGAVATGIGARLRAAGAITGVVKNAAGRGLRSICPVAVGLTGQPSTTLSQLVSDPVQTDATGAYRITGLAAGTYAVEFEPCNGQPYAQGWYANAGSAGSARPVTVRDGLTTAGINQVMTGGGAVAGTVTASGSGSPVRGECAEVVDSGGVAIAGAVTTSTGGYRFGHLAAGTYHLVFFACRRAQAGLADVTRPGVRVTNGRLTKANATLPAAGSVAGTVLAGNPAAAQPGICVEVTPETGNGAAGLTATGQGGSYQLTGLAPGSYQVVFTPDCVAGAGAFMPQALTSPVSVTAGTTTSGVDATLAADGGISGTVQVSAAPAAGVCVIAYPSAGQSAPSVAVTASDGSYQVTGLRPGSYQVEFTAGCGAASYVTQWYNGASSRSGAAPVTVSAGTVTSAIDAH